MKPTLLNIPQGIYELAHAELERRRVLHPEYWDDELLMLMVCEYMMKRK
jgi:hypothetical protein